MPRSYCPQCNTMIAWYDNIPVLSWLLLDGRCRSCKKAISFLYPFIELLTAILLSLLYFYIPQHYFFAYFVFFSALIVTIRSDIETMLISQYVTIFLIPFGFVFSACGLLPISLFESITGAVFGYLFLFSVNYIFKKLRNKNGIGEGDFDLLLFIGSFTGVLGCWATITIGSIAGSLYGFMYLLYDCCINRNNTITQNTKIPFGPFLALGAILFVFLHNHIVWLLLY